MNFPYTSAINVVKRNGVSFLDQALFTRLQHQKFASFRFDDSKLGRVRSNNPYALAFVLTRESISVEPIGLTFKVLIIITAEALFYNEAARDIIADYPFGFQYVDLSSRRPSHQDLMTLVRNLYVGRLSANIFRAFVKRLHGIRLKPYYGNTIRVVSVRIHRFAQRLLPTRYQHHLMALKSYIAEQMSADLSTQNHVPVLPYVEGNAIGNMIALRFANGRVFNLGIPKPDYAIVLTLLGFKRVPYQKGSWGTSWLYGAFMHVSIEEPLSGHKYMGSTVKQATLVIVPSSQKSVDYWPAEKETLSRLLYGLSIAIAHPNRHWARIHMGNTHDVQQLFASKKVIDSCR